MPRPNSPAFVRTITPIGGTVGAWAGTDARVLADTLVLGFRYFFEKLVYVVGAVAGAGASGNQTFMLRKGAASFILTTTTAADPAAGATNIKLTSVTGIEVGHWLIIATSLDVEARKITVVGTSGGGGTGVTVSEAFTADHGNGAVAYVSANPPLAFLELAVADATVGKVVTASRGVGASATPAALESFVAFNDTDGFSINRVAGGTAYTTEPLGSFFVVSRQQPQARL